jgi:hypothetical protein
MNSEGWATVLDSARTYLMAGLDESLLTDVNTYLNNIATGVYGSLTSSNPKSNKEIIREIEVSVSDYRKALVANA